MDEVVDVFRKCQRCGSYRSLDDFLHLAVVCQWCMHTYPDLHGRRGLIRGLVITDKGRAALREMQSVA